MKISKIPGGTKMTFSSIQSAKKYQKTFFKDYGYSPQIFDINKKIVIVKPSSLRKR